jgi:hypothetical protein
LRVELAAANGIKLEVSKRDAMAVAIGVCPGVGVGLGELPATAEAGASMASQYEHSEQGEGMVGTKRLELLTSTRSKNRVLVTY